MTANQTTNCTKPTKDPLDFVRFVEFVVPSSIGGV
jgi:hypothetical protein